MTHEQNVLEAVSSSPDTVAEHTAVFHDLFWNPDH